VLQDFYRDDERHLLPATQGIYPGDTKSTWRFECHLAGPPCLLIGVSNLFWESLKNYFLHKSSCMFDLLEINPRKSENDPRKMNICGAASMIDCERSSCEWGVSPPSGSERFDVSCLFREECL
jgi:hypothetical protein